MSEDILFYANYDNLPESTVTMRLREDLLSDDKKYFKRQEFDSGKRAGKKICGLLSEKFARHHLPPALDAWHIAFYERNSDSSLDTEMKKLIHSRDWGILMTVGCITKWFTALLICHLIAEAFDRSAFGEILSIVGAALVFAIAQWIRKEMTSIYQIVKISKLPDGFDFFEQGEPKKHTSITIRRMQ